MVGKVVNLVAKMVGFLVQKWFGKWSGFWSKSGWENGRVFGPKVVRKTVGVLVGTGQNLLEKWSKTNVGMTSENDV